MHHWDPSPSATSTRTGTKRKLSGSTSNDQAKANKTNKITPEAPSKLVPRKRKGRVSFKLEDEKPDMKNKECGSGGNGGEPCHISWRYHTVDVEKQSNACIIMGLQFHGPNSDTRLSRCCHNKTGWTYSKT